MNDRHRIAALGAWPSLKEQRQIQIRNAQDRVRELRAKAGVLSQAVTLAQNPAFKLYLEKIEELRNMHLERLVDLEDNASRGAVRMAEGILAIHRNFEELYKPLAEELKKAETALESLQTTVSENQK